jgi:hypothetical protein
MILAQSTYGVTISSEGITIIIVLLVGTIVTFWVRAFIAKPDTLSSRLDAFMMEVNKQNGDFRMELKDLKNEIERNSEKDIDLRQKHTEAIAKMEAKIDNKMWDMVKEAIKK